MVLMEETFPMLSFERCPNIVHILLEYWGGKGSGFGVSEWFILLIESEFRFQSIRGLFFLSQGCPRIRSSSPICAIRMYVGNDFVPTLIGRIVKCVIWTPLICDPSTFRAWIGSGSW